MYRSAPSCFTLLVAAATCSSFFAVTMTLAQQKHQPAAHHTTGVTCIPHERDALLAFKAGITGDPGRFLASWQEEDGEDCCQWNGVLCSNHTGHVLKLELGSNSLVGQISHSLLSLEQLEHLDLSGNSLNGSPGGSIPELLGSFRNLNYLDVSNMSFSGRVPSHLGNLSNLQYLDLSFTGDTYSADLSWLTHLHLLQYLSLSGVNLSAAVDWAHAVNMLPSLRVLQLFECSLTSANQSLPHHNLTNLEHLDLFSNYFDHPIASCWFWNITHLKYLDLAFTGLYGPLPRALEGMTYLQYLDISKLYDSKAKFIMTTNLRNHCSLESLITGCSLIYGDITELLESLPQCSSNRLVELDHSFNNISGVLPTNWMWPITSLESLELSSNSISGILPNWMGQLTSLDFLDLSSNTIRGVLPKWIGKLTSLGYFSLQQNNIGGILPNSMGQLTSLFVLDLSENNIGGMLPNSMGKMASLELLALDRNNITGPLPSFVGHFASLSYLQLSYNHLTGQVPYEIGMLSNLESLDLSNNDLDGTMTEEHFTSLRSLQWIDLSYNSLKININLEWKPPFRLQEAYFASCCMGPLFPSWLKWMVDIIQLDISNTGINDRLPDWFCSTFSKTTNMNISNNKIYGGLPADMENMSLELLFFASNQLTGPIAPMPINLSTLDLSRNFLSGPLL